MLTYDDLTWAGGLVFDDLDEAAVTAYLQQANVQLVLSAAATQDTVPAYEQLFDPELILSADAVQEYVSPGMAVAYLQSANVQIVLFTSAVQEHIPIAAGELGQSGTAMLMLSADSYQQYIEGANAGDVLHQANVQVGLTANAAQTWEAPALEVPPLPEYLQVSTAQLLLSAGGIQTFIEGSNFRTTVAEFLEELCFDELSDMFIGNRTSMEEVRPKLLPLMNTSMTYAYAKFEGTYGSTILEAVPGLKTYQLRNADILQIVELINVYGYEIPQSEYRVVGQTITFNEAITQDVEIVYKSKHVKYTLAQDDTQVLVKLPDMLMPWLKAYVCYLYFRAMKTADAQAKAADYLLQAQMYENMFVQTNTTNEFTATDNVKMEARGFA